MALKRQRRRSVSDFGFRRWKLARHNRVGEPHAVVAPVAERFVGGVPAAAQRDHRASGQPELVSRRIQNLKLSLNAYRTVIQTSDLRWHLSDGSTRVAQTSAARKG